ncbi:MAG: TauD/TfdA family dioxygenase [Legionellaceae bacterium]|nr:TauD/TfdA family dioxygenase [Legionellaceae bacterium]
MIKILKTIHDHVNSESYCAHSGRVISSNCVLDFRLNHPQEITSVIKEEGFAIVNCKGYSMLDTLRLIKKTLGFPIKNGACGREGYLTKIINTDVKGCVNTYTASAYSEPLHTDGADSASLPRFVSFFCIKSSGTGGVSTIVKVNELLITLQQLFGQEVDQLFKKDFMQIDTMYGRNIKKQVLFNLDEKNVGMLFWPVMFNVKTSETGYKILAYINDYIHNPENQYRFKLKENELLILDNCKVLHSRTAFDPIDNRCLIRIWHEDLDPVRLTDKHAANSNGHVGCN